MNLYDYISNNTDKIVVLKAQKIVMDCGYKKAANPDELADSLQSSVNKCGKRILFKIAEFHPDRALILNSVKEEINKKLSFCGGCVATMGADGNISVEKTETKEKDQEKEKEKEVTAPKKLPKGFYVRSDLMIFGGVIIIVMAAMLIKWK